MSKKSSQNDFYVYEYLRARDSKEGPKGSPYYVGKGRGYRESRARNHYVPIPPNKKHIVKVSAEMCEVDALQLEMLLIHLYGRVDLGTGCLNNMTDGGDGVRGADAVRNAEERWGSATKEERAAHRFAVKAWHESLTDDQKGQREAKLREAAIGQWTNMTGEERAEWLAARNEGWANRTDEEKLATFTKMSAVRKALIANLSSEEKEERNALLHAALLGRWAKTSRRTHCPKGHPYNEENTYTKPSNGHRQCKICVRASRARHLARKAAGC